MSAGNANANSVIAESLAAALPLFRALGEPSRAEIVATLLQCGGAASVGELQAQLGLPQSTISRHLRVLLDSHVVSVERRGTQRIYRLDVLTAHLDALDALVRDVRACQHDET